MASIWTRKTAAADSSYKRVLGRLDLTNIGIAAIIGAGIFVFLGEEAIGTGPAVVIALILAGTAAMLSAFSYAEASAISPGNGSAYGFAYAALGNFPAFMVGWLYINGYVIGNAGVGQAWSKSFVAGSAKLGLTIPDALTKSPLEGGIVNLPSLVFFALITAFALAGMAESKRANNILVALKLGIVIFIIGMGAFLLEPSNWKPFAPAGIGSIASSTAILFFAYLGFDTIAATGAEAKRPRRDLPVAILLSIGLCMVLYVLMALTITGIAPSAGLNPDEPTADAFGQAGAAWAGGIITIGILIGLATVAYAFHMASARIMQAMADDGFLPKRVGAVGTRGVPVIATLIVGGISAIAAGFLPLEILISSSVEANILIFISVSIGILVLRRLKGKPDGFAPPAWVHVAAIIALSGVIVFGIWDPVIHIATLAWVAIGFVLYGFWAHRASLRVSAEKARNAMVEPVDGTLVAGDEPSASSIG